MASTKASTSPLYIAWSKGFSRHHSPVQARKITIQLAVPRYIQDGPNRRLPLVQEPLKHTHCFKELLLLFFCACSHYLICTGRGVFERLIAPSMPPSIDQIGGKALCPIPSFRKRAMGITAPERYSVPPFPICCSKELYTNIALHAARLMFPPICQVEIRSESRVKK